MEGDTVSRTIEHADVTGSEWRLAALPELVHELGRLGYRAIGRVVQRSGGGSDSQFDRVERQRLHAWRARPAATMLAAADAAAFVTVDTYGDAPLLRFRTVLTDGTLVETVSVTSDGILRPRPGLDPLEGFTVGDAPGRSVVLLTDLSVAEVARAHRGRVRALAGAAEPRDHASMADAVALWNDAARHTLDTSRTLARWRQLLGLGWLLVVSVPVVVVALALDRTTGAGAVAVAALLTLVAGATLTVLVRPIRACSRALGRARWWRPAYVAGASGQ
jgi:hypothetical protein